MSAPTPAVPEEGAAFYSYRDVPVGWEYRLNPTSGWTTKVGDDMGRDARYVEARPKPEPLVAVMLPRKDVEAYRDWADTHRSPILAAACRAALEAEGER